MMVAVPLSSFDRPFTFNVPLATKSIKESTRATRQTASMASKRDQVVTYTSLVAACWQRHRLSTIEDLLRDGADANAAEMYGSIPVLPIVMAMRRNWTKLIRLLVRYDARVPTNGMTEAIRMGCSLKTLAALRDAGGDVCERYLGRLALCRAIEHDALDKARWFVRNGCTARVWCDADRHAMQEALAHVSNDMVQWIIVECGIPVPDANEWIYILHGAPHGHRPTAEFETLYTQAVVTPDRIHPRHWVLCAAEWYATMDVLCT